MDSFVNKYRCSYCLLSFRRPENLKIHLRSGMCLSPYVYRGGVHERTKNIWEVLDELNVDYSDIDISWNRRVTWDIETKAVDYENPKRTSKTVIRKKHVPVSIAFRSNVPGFDEETFFKYNDKSTHDLFTWMYDLMKQIQEKSEKDWHSKMSIVYDQIERRIIHLGGSVKVPEARWLNYDEELRQKLRRNSEKCFQNDLDKHTCDFDLPLKECFQLDQRKEPLSHVQSQSQKTTVQRSEDLTQYFPSQYIVEDEDEEDVEMDDLEEYLTGGAGDMEADVEPQQVHKDQKRRKKKGSALVGYINKLKRTLEEVKGYGASLPVVGYNSSQFDLGCFAEVWPVVFGFTGAREVSCDDENDIEETIEDEDEEGVVTTVRNKKIATHKTKKDKVHFRPSIIGKSKNYKQIVTVHGLKFLDLMNYVPAKTSLDKLVKSYGLPEEKGFFPYNALGAENFGTMKMSLDSSSYDLFVDDLTLPPHRVQGHLLEKEWQTYTKQKFRSLEQPVIYDMAVHLAQKSSLALVEGTGLSLKDKFREEKNSWLQMLGFNGVNIQKPRTVDTEDFISLKPSYMEPMEEDVQRRTHFHWLNATEKKKASVKNSVKTATKSQIVTGVENLHKHVVNVWREKEIEDMYQYLEWYNKKDVEIMHPVIDAMQENYRNIDPSCQLFNDNMSLPNIARSIGYKSCESAGGVFFLPKGDNEGLEFERVIRRNLNGGPSIIFNRDVTAFVSTIEGTHNKVQVVKTYDANALYPKCMSTWLPVGHNVHVYKPDKEGKWQYKELGKSLDSFVENMWLEEKTKEIEYEARVEQDKYPEEEKHTYPKIQILNKKSVGRIARVGQYEVDGIRYRNQFTDEELRKYGPRCKGVVYEFLGDYFHGNPALIVKREKDGKEEQVKLLKERLTKTRKKFQDIINLGYAIDFVWEGDFMRRNGRIYSNTGFVPQFTSRYLFAKDKNRRTEIMKEISDPRKFSELLMRQWEKEKVLKDDDTSYFSNSPSIYFFGMAEVDLECPDIHVDYMDKFPPLFVKGTLPGETSAQLRGVLGCKQALLTTPYIQCLLSLGFKVTKVYQAWEFRAAKCLKPFIDKVVYERRKGDMLGGNPLQANTYKLLGNSFYGGSVMNKDHHSDICYCNNRFEVCKQINKPTFCDADSINNNLFELHTNRRKINQNIPIQVGKFVLDAAKIHMINFYYHVILEHCDRKKIDLVSMDTDSFTFALAAEDIHATVYPSMQKSWDEIVKPRWFSHSPCDTKTFCDIASDCNKRLPGPFKEEFSGDKAIGLSSKLFTVTAMKPGGETKTASKGLKQKNMFDDASQLFQRTLINNEPMIVQYTSLQRQKETMATLDSSRAVSRKYCKRKINENDISRTTSIKEPVFCGTPAKKKKINQLRISIKSEIKKALKL